MQPSKQQQRHGALLGGRPSWFGGHTDALLKSLHRKGTPGMLAKHSGEHGSSVVVAVVTLPLLLLFLFAAIDLGRVVFLEAETNTAAHAVCRGIVAEGRAIASNDELRAMALQASPSLGGNDLGLRIEASVGESTEQSLSYQLHEQDHDFSSYEIRTCTRPVEVQLVVRGSYLTPLGSLFAGGGDATFSCSAQVSGVIDETTGV